MSKQANNYTYDELQVGQTAEFETKVTEALVSGFADFSGDYNPLHTDLDYAAHTEFKKPIAHGMIAGALFSRLVGMELPGRKSLYLSQSLKFIRPIMINSTIKIWGEITHKSDALNTVTLAVKVFDLEKGTVLVEGQALVRVLDRV